MANVVRHRCGEKAGWQARLHWHGGRCGKRGCRCKKAATKYFADKRWGGSRLAKNRAKDWLDGGYRL